MHGDARHLVEGAYGPEASARMPNDLEEVHHRVATQRRIVGATATINAVSPSAGYSVGPVDYWRDELTLTRLGEPQQTVALATKIAGAKLTPIGGGFDCRAWSQSTRSLRRSMLTGVVLEARPDSIPLLRRSKMIILNDTRHWGSSAEFPEAVCYYDQERGFRVVPR